MVDIDRQIVVAKRKPLTVENLNYIGDLYLKKDDRELAVAYFFEACDKLHIAQKDKKLALYKKILKISPVSEKAYIGIIEILSKMGLVIEEKKYMHMLAQLYESRGEAVKASELQSRIKDLDPHVIPDGTFFQQEAHKEVMELREVGSERSAGEKEDEIEDVPIIRSPAYDLSVSAADMQEKLIEASLEEIKPQESSPEPDSLKSRFGLRYLLGGAIALCAILAGFLFYFSGGNRGSSIAQLPLNARINDYELNVSRLDDPAELTGIINNRDLGNTDFFLFTVNSRLHCVPEAFATLPHKMILLLDMKGEPVQGKPIEGLQKTTKTVSKMNVCGRESAIVFLRTIIAADRKKEYSGLIINGLQNSGPITLTWNLK